MDEANQKTCKASNEDLMRRALQDYNDESMAACHWNSSIPRAIKFYFEARPRLERFAEALKEQIDNERGRDGKLSMDGVLKKYQLELILDILKESN